MYDTKLYLYDTLFYHNISWKTMSYHRKLYHIVTYYPIRYQIMIQYHIIWYNMILYDIKVCFYTYHTYYKILCHMIHYCHFFYNSMQYHIIHVYAWHNIVSHDTVQYHILQLRILWLIAKSYHIQSPISFCIILCIRCVIFLLSYWVKFN